MSTLSAKAEEMAVLVARGETVIGAGEKVGYSRSQSYRYGRADDFRLLVAEVRGRLVDEAIGIGAAALTGSMTRFATLVASTDEMVALRAGKLVVDAFIGLSTHADLVGRIEALERTAREQLEGASQNA